ncbi:MAG: LON peptidase substrate-binding domain-containing protein [Proteobacteria bacterium]|nr:LON peptidase substrate-binding domain-containing protein [Pseudomonadota bacterium]
MQLHNRDLTSVPMFPLPDVVLLPGTLLPLHIFEPRYREMTRDVLAGPRLIALARLHDDYSADDFGRPAVYSTIGVGHVLASNELDDGRYNILVRGLVRAWVAEELPPDRSYRLVRATVIPDRQEGDPAILRAAHQQLIGLCDQLSTAMSDGGEQLRQLARTAEEAGSCADLVFSAIVSDADERQVLLETQSPLERLEQAMQQVTHLLTRLGGTTELPN